MHEKWQRHIDFIREHVDAMPPGEMAAVLGVSEHDLRLFMHRSRLFPRREGRRNLLLEMLEARFGRPEYFRPTRDFYRAVGIGQRRWWQLYRGEQPLTETEYRNLASHLGVSLQDAFEMRQLTLLDDVHFGTK